MRYYLGELDGIDANTPSLLFELASLILPATCWWLSNIQAFSHNPQGNPMHTPKQLELFQAVQNAYANSDGTLTQAELYASVSSELNLDPTQHYGQAGKATHNLLYRQIRFIQQSLKQNKLLVNVSRGCWRYTGKKQDLQMPEEGKSILALSTKLGIIISSDCLDVLNNDIIEDQIDLVVSSPPYLLNDDRNYGGIGSNPQEYVDFLMSVIEKLIPRMSAGASIALNIGDDCFEKGSPSRHMHIAELMVALKKAGLYYMGTVIWDSNKPPGPTYHACVNSVQLRVEYEPILWFTNNPMKVRSCNRRVRQPHTSAHQSFVRSGGTRKAAQYGDGANTKRVGDYAKTDLSAGRILTNVWKIGNKCRRNELCNAYTREVLGQTPHGAKFPYRLAELLVKFLSRPGDLVVDLFGGTGTLGQAAEDAGRKWVVVEKMKQYIESSFIRFAHVEDVYFNPAFITPSQEHQEKYRYLH